MEKLDERAPVRLTAAADHGITLAIDVPAALMDLSALYADAGHALWLVGGCVRDAVLERPAKDIDLATSATPEEQIALCRASGLRFVPTGLQHGTITVLTGGEGYEITTFRTDVETDGRHAVVAYTRDLTTDLERRDLTFNAIAMSFDGRVADPFGGVADALTGTVRFVGDPAARIAEDHLRILRWFRFWGRLGDHGRIDPDAMAAIREGRSGLRRISAERVWSEVSAILTGAQPSTVVRAMIAAGVMTEIGCPDGEPGLLHWMRNFSADPAVLAGAWLGTGAEPTLTAWKASSRERRRAAFVHERLETDRYDLTAAKRDLVDGAEDPETIAAVLGMRGFACDVAALRSWAVPTMPIGGDDLTAAGMVPGRGLGAVLARVRGEWIASGYAMDRTTALRSALNPSE